MPKAQHFKEVDKKACFNCEGTKSYLNRSIADFGSVPTNKQSYLKKLKVSHETFEV